MSVQLGVLFDDWVRVGDRHQEETMEVDYGRAYSCPLSPSSTPLLLLLPIAILSGGLTMYRFTLAAEHQRSQLLSRTS